MDAEPFANYRGLTEEEFSRYRSCYARGSAQTMTTNRCIPESQGQNACKLQQPAGPVVK